MIKYQIPAASCQLLATKMLQQIKTLREKSGAGMVACKKALEEARGDIDKALEILRKQGIAKAAKREDRVTSEGVVKLTASEDNKKGYILKINSETDFVARNDQFQEFGDQVLKLVKENNPADLEALLEIKMEDGNSVKENLENLSGIIGEKLVISEYALLATNGTVAGYSHAGGKIGALAALDKEGEADLTRDIAMHVAASDPQYLEPSEVKEEEIAKEKEIYRERLLKEGKPENIIDKILEGKINKYFEEICLIRQDFIKDDKKKIQDILGGANIEKFIRFSL